MIDNLTHECTLFERQHVDISGGSVTLQHAANNMGLHDRDYMKRRSDDEAEHGSSPDARFEVYLSRFLGRHPRFIVVAGIVLAGLVGLAILFVKFADKSQ